METINTQKTQVKAALKENSELCAGIQHVINHVRLPEDMGKTWAEFFPSLSGWFDNYVWMASKLVMLSALAQIQVLWPTTQLERLVEENTNEAYHQAVDQAEVRLDAIAEQIANHLDLGGDHPKADNQHPPPPP
jgi:heme exporter protein D